MMNFQTKLNERIGPLARVVDHRSYLIDRWRRATVQPMPERAGDDELGHLPARIDYGQWIVDCPCKNAAMVDLDDLYFICAVCLTGEWWIVDLPLELADIEAVLLERTERAPVGFVNRHWSPGESVDDLIKENIEHGVDIPTHLEGRSTRNGGGP